MIMWITYVYITWKIVDTDTKRSTLRDRSKNPASINRLSHTATGYRGHTVKSFHGIRLF